MKIRDARLQRVGITLLEYLFALTLGTILGLRLWWSVRISRQIRIHGYHHFRDATRKGGVLIVANHPSLIEPALIPGLGWPRMLQSPRHYFFWSMPDRRLFPRGLKWIHLARGIEVDRSLPSSLYNGRALNRAKAILQSGQTVVIHGEGGRTFKWRDRQWYSTPPKLLTAGERELGELNPAILRLAIKADALILPLWVNMPSEIRKPRTFWESFPIWLFGRFKGVTFRFDHPAYKAPTSDPVIEAKRLEHLLLNQEGEAVSVVEGLAKA